MKVDISSLPDNTDELKEVISYLSSSHAQLEDKEKAYQEKIEYLEERIRLLTKEIFGRKTEK